MLRGPGEGVVYCTDEREFRELWSDLCAESGRIDEALAVCQKRSDEDAAPLTLQVCEAQIICRYGEISSGVQRLERIVLANPDFVPAWEALAQWCDPEADVKAGLEIGTNLTRLLPETSQAWAYLTDAYLANHDMEEAMDAARKALELDPRNVDAGKSLFNLCLMNHDGEEAAKVLDRFAPFVPYEEFLPGEIELSDVPRGSRRLVGKPDPAV